jgi:DNA-binding MarR family transcriptional regulator
MGPQAYPRASSRSVREILDAVRHLVRSLRLTHQDARRRIGLSAAQVFVLQSLKDGEGASLNDVAERTSTDQSSVSVVVARLAKQGLLSRERSAHDGRQLVLKLTPEGRALLRDAPPSLAQETLVAALEGLSVVERRTLARLLKRVVETMGADARVPAMFFETQPKARRTTEKETRRHGA